MNLIFLDTIIDQLPNHTIDRRAGSTRRQQLRDAIHMTELQANKYGITENRFKIVTSNVLDRDSQVFAELIMDRGSESEHVRRIAEEGLMKLDRKIVQGLGLHNTDVLDTLGLDPEQLAFYKTEPSLDEFRAEATRDLHKA